MDEESVIIADLKAQLATADERRQVEEERRQAAEERQRVAEERQCAAEESLDAVTRPTTFQEYLNLLHRLYATRLSYDPDCPRNTKGGVTNPRHRITPTVIAPWEEFEDEQAATYRELCKEFQDQRLFPTESEVIGAQRTINEFLITSEKSLTNFTDVAMVAPVKEIVNQSIAFGHVGGDPGLGVSFSPRGDPEEDTKAAFAPVDGVWDRGGPITLLELKTPHKLTERVLQTALDDGTGCARRRFETKPIIDSPHATKDPTYTIVAVFTQIFDYMITTGTARAWLYTGMASVYFEVPRLDPSTLYFNLKIHPRSSTASPEETSVCQDAVFVRRCVFTQKRDADWIRDAVDSNGRFLVDPEAQLNLMSSPLSSASEVVTPGKEDYKAPKRKRQSTPEVNRPSHRNDDTSGDDGGDYSSPIRRPATRSRTRGPADDFTTSVAGGDGGPRSSPNTGKMASTRCMLCAPPQAARQYCSQACLRGLRYSDSTKISRELDMACPNATRHSRSFKHELTLRQLHDSLRQQLDCSHTHAIEYLGLHGSSGHLFAITLCSHGYTFVGKGSRSDQVPNLMHEYGIYETLHPLQGHYIPVCLGLFDLEGPYYLPSPDHLTHFLLLSYAGIRLSRYSKLLPPTDEVISSAEIALKKVHDFNLTHRDSCVENMLWNTELHGVMIIDFGSSTLLDIRNAAPSVRHHASTRTKGKRRVIQMDMNPRSPAGVRKKRNTSSRHGKLFWVEERRCELDAIKREVLRWLPAPAT